MAVAVDAVSTGRADGATLSLTFSHVCAGAFRGLIVAVGTNGGLPTGVTYAGVPMTQVGTTQEVDTGHRISLWRLIQPGTGANNVVISWSSVVVCEAAAISFTGVDQVTMTGSYSGASGNNNAPTVNVSSNADHLVVGALVWNHAVTPATATAGSGQTQRWNGNGTYVGGAGTTELGAASVTTSWSMSASTNWAVGGVSIRPNVEAAPTNMIETKVPARHPSRDALAYASFTFGAVGPNFTPPPGIGNAFFTAFGLG